MKNSLFRPIGLSLIVILTLFLVISCGRGRTEPEEPLPTPTEETVVEPTEAPEEPTEAPSQPASPLADGKSESPLPTPVAEAVESAPVSTVVDEAIAAIEQGEYNIARSQLDQAIANGEDLIRAYTTRGDLSFEQLRFMESEQDYTAAIAIEPTLNTLVQRCQIYKMLGRYDEAIQDSFRTPPPRIDRVGGLRGVRGPDAGVHHLRDGRAGR